MTLPLYRDPRALALVFLGGAAGTLARAGVGILLTDVAVLGYPIPNATTIVVNLVGAFLIGALAGFLAGRSSAASRRFYLLASTGFLGAFTTYSAFVAGALPVAGVSASGDDSSTIAFDISWYAVAFPALMLVAGVALAFGGLALGRRLAAPRTDAARIEATRTEAKARVHAGIRQPAQVPQVPSQRRESGNE